MPIRLIQIGTVCGSGGLDIPDNMPQPSLGWERRFRLRGAVRVPFIRRRKSKTDKAPFGLMTFLTRPQFQAQDIVSFAYRRYPQFQRGDLARKRGASFKNSSARLPSANLRVTIGHSENVIMPEPSFNFRHADTGLTRFPPQCGTTFCRARVHVSMACSSTERRCAPMPGSGSGLSAPCRPPTQSTPC